MKSCQNVVSFTLASANLIWNWLSQVFFSHLGRTQTDFCLQTTKSCPPHPRSASSSPGWEVGSKWHWWPFGPLGVVPRTNQLLPRAWWFSWRLAVFQKGNGRELERNNNSWKPKIPWNFVRYDIMELLPTLWKLSQGCILIYILICILMYILTQPFTGRYLLNIYRINQ